MKGGTEMLNSDKLKARIVEAGYTQKKFAEAIQISQNTLTSRLQGKSYFNTEEIDRICSVLNIANSKDKVNIFLT